MADYPDMWHTVLVKCPACKAVIMPEDISDHKAWHDKVWMNRD